MQSNAAEPKIADAEEAVGCAGRLALACYEDVVGLDVAVNAEQRVDVLQRGKLSGWTRSRTQGSEARIHFLSLERAGSPFAP